jgi:hypothetical protein
MDYTKLTLGELLSSTDEIIKRNATSILKQLQRAEAKKIEVKSESVETKFMPKKRYCTRCGYVEAQITENCKECGSTLTHEI